MVFLSVSDHYYEINQSLIVPFNGPDFLWTDKKL